MFTVALLKIARNCCTFVATYKQVMNEEIKHGVVTPELLCSSEKEWGTDTCRNMRESWKKYVKWKKLDAKEHVLYGGMSRTGKFIKKR